MSKNIFYSPASSCRYPATLAVDFWMTCVTQHADIADTATMTVMAVAPPTSTVLICQYTLGISLNLQSTGGLPLKSEQRKTRYKRANCMQRRAFNESAVKAKTSNKIRDVCF